MNIIDTNGIQHIFINKISLSEKYYLAPDTAEEVEMTKVMHGKKLPDEIIEVSSLRYFNWPIYLDYYKKDLNKFSGRSFFNMTGFGDISILAVLHMFVDIFEKQKREQLFDPTEEINIYTDDNSLTTKINKEFGSYKIFVHSISQIGR